MFYMRRFRDAYMVTNMSLNYEELTSHREPKPFFHNQNFIDNNEKNKGVNLILTILVSLKCST